MPRANVSRQSRSVSSRARANYEIRPTGKLRRGICFFFPRLRPLTL